MSDDVYYHDHGDGVVHAHHLDGEHGHSHTHTHPHTQTKAVLMIEDGRDCTEVLIQIAAVRSALSSTAKVILKDHLEHCITDDQSSGDQLQALNEAIDKFM